MFELKKNSSQILILTIEKTMDQKSKAGTIVERKILAIGVPICSRYNDNSPHAASFRVVWNCGAEGSVEKLEARQSSTTAYIESPH